MATANDAGDIYEFAMAFVAHLSDWDSYEDYYVDELLPQLLGDPSKRDGEERALFERYAGFLAACDISQIQQTIRGLRRGIRPPPPPPEPPAQHSPTLEEVLGAFHAMLTTDFLGACGSIEVADERKEIVESKHRHMVEFVQNWFEVPGGSPVDTEQAASIAALAKNTLVVARAGSGKTRTLVNRAIFLQKHCGVPPNSILLLAFNRKAAKEMESRLSEVLDPLAPMAMTFHALAYGLVHPEEPPLSDDAKLGRFDKSAVVQRLVDQRIRNPMTISEIRRIMLQHFRVEWDRIVDGGYAGSPDEMLKIRRALQYESLDGRFVKSFGEKRIADFLFEHQVPYRYEQNHWWDGRNYRPDFTISLGKNTGVVIEYFGLTGKQTYDQQSEEKRKYWSDKPGWALLEAVPEDIIEGKADKFFESLKDKLSDMGIHCVRLSEDQIWERVRDRAVDRFSMALTQFIGNCRKLSWEPDEVDQACQHHQPLSTEENDFLELARKLYREYIETLKSTGEDDFDGLLQKAIARVKAGDFIVDRKAGRCNLAQLRYVLIDEFQDFSNLFFQLITAIRNRDPAVQFFCVGDDWQAINAFAGSDVKFFRDFETYFNPAHREHLTTNYRSAKAIVGVSNALMAGRGISGKPSPTAQQGEVLVADLEKFSPEDIEKDSFFGDILTPVLLRIIDHSFQRKESKVVVLSRTNFIPWYTSKGSRSLEEYGEILRGHYFPGNANRISFSTAHSYKGLESDVVIIIDATTGRYPLIHPDWVFARLFRPALRDLIDDERRLLYVALTRATKELFLITERARTSAFLRDINDRIPLAFVNWHYYPTPLRHYSALVVRVQGAFEIRDTLKTHGFRWHAENRCWEKRYTPTTFQLNRVLGIVSAASADRILFAVSDNLCNTLAEYTLERGIPHCRFNKLPPANR